MRYLFYVVFLFLTISCSLQNDKTSSIEIVKDFYKGLNQSNYELVENYLGDSLAMNENEWNYYLTFSRAEFKDWFQWDSTFKPKYEIVEIAEKNDTVFATITKIDNRIQLLNQKPITYKVHFDIVDSKLIALNRYKYLQADWTIWQSNREEFIKWIDNFHPDYSGFMNAQNKEYGEKYLKAINLYLEREKQLAEETEFTIIDAWGNDELGNAYFAFYKDSIYYPDPNHWYRYDIVGDTIRIFKEENNIERLLIKQLDQDSLIVEYLDYEVIESYVRRK